MRSPLAVVCSLFFVSFVNVVYANKNPQIQVLSHAKVGSCVGLIDIHIVAPTPEQMRWRASLRLPDNKRFTGYFWQSAKKPTTSTDKLAKNFPKLGAGIRQSGPHSFKMRKSSAPDCEIKILDYGLFEPSLQPNMYGTLIAPLILAYDEQSRGEPDEWGSEPGGPEVTDDSWAAFFGIEEVDKQDTGEIIGSSANNPWESESSSGKPDDWDEDGDGYHDADTNKDKVVDVWEELSWAGGKVKHWFQNGGILSLF